MVSAKRILFIVSLATLIFSLFIAQEHFGDAGSFIVLNVSLGLIVMYCHKLLLDKRFNELYRQLMFRSGEHLKNAAQKRDQEEVSRRVLQKERRLDTDNKNTNANYMILIVLFLVCWTMTLVVFAYSDRRYSIPMAILAAFVDFYIGHQHWEFSRREKAEEDFALSHTRDVEKEIGNLHARHNPLLRKLPPKRKVPRIRP